MSTERRVAKSEVDKLPKDLLELASALEALPSEYRLRIDPLIARVVESTTRRRRILVLIQESLSQLRLDMKYLLFDLHATRRERDEYRKSLEGE